MYRSFTFLVKFIRKCFIVFDTIENEIIFLISFSDSSLLVYGNTLILVCWLYILQLYWSHLFINLEQDMHEKRNLRDGISLKSKQPKVTVQVAEPRCSPGVCDSKAVSPVLCCFALVEKEHFGSRHFTLYASPSVPYSGFFTLFWPHPMLDCLTSISPYLQLVILQP